jgi:hypothetical protein
MEFEIQNFIYEKRNALSHETCQKLMDKGESILNIAFKIPERKDRPYSMWGSESTKGGNPLSRQDYALFIPDVMHEFFDEIMECIWTGLHEYQSQIGAASQPVYTNQAKFQKTPSGGGFSNWHVEQGTGNTSNRFLVWMIYLNNVDSGGDTEFLYQGIKTKAEAGKLVLFPAGLTHPHRGNPPYNQDKYILTGWFLLPQFENQAEYIHHER